jgi:AcrR family transcriptional regulator
VHEQSGWTAADRRPGGVSSRWRQSCSPIAARRGPRVLELAGLSRGSLYRHVAGKDRLFEAVVEVVQARVGEDTLGAATASGETEAPGLLGPAELAWIRLAGDPVVRRILLIDAPTVLGWRRWREIGGKPGLGC